MSGWLKLWRKFRESELWKEKRKFSRAEAWLDLIMEANHETKIWRGRTIERGCLVTSEHKLAQSWQWSRSAVRRFLNALEAGQRANKQPDNGCTIIRITNYEQYQGIEGFHEQVTGQATGQRADKKPDTPKEERKKKKEERKDLVIVQSDLPEFCPALPASLDNEVGKAALRTWDEFKRAKRQGYKSSHGWSSLLSEYEPLGAEALADAVKWSTGRNYTGVFRKPSEKTDSTLPARQTSADRSRSILVKAIKGEK